MSENANNDPSPGEDVTEHLKSRSTWLRLGFMILFAVAFYVAELVLVVVALLQFLWKLLSAKTNDRLGILGEALGRYLYQIVRYLTFNTDDMPFPFADWPGDAPAKSGAGKTTPAKPTRAARSTRSSRTTKK